MKATTYQITMSNGSRHEISAQSAAVAIEEALWATREATVVSCYSGLTDDDAAYARAAGFKNAMPGRIIHDVPKHIPISADAKRNPESQARRAPTPSLFSSDESKRLEISP